MAFEGVKQIGHSPPVDIPNKGDSQPRSGSRNESRLTELQPTLPTTASKSQNHYHEVDMSDREPTTETSSLEKVKLESQVQLLKDELARLEQKKHILRLEIEKMLKEKESEVKHLTDRLEKHEKHVKGFRQAMLRYETRAEGRIAALEERIREEEISQYVLRDELVEFAEENGAEEVEVSDMESEDDENRKKLEALWEEMSAMNVDGYAVQEDYDSLLATNVDFASNDLGKQESPSREAIQVHNEGYQVIIQDLERIIAGIEVNLSTGQAEKHGKAPHKTLEQPGKYFESLCDARYNSTQSELDVSEKPITDTRTPKNPIWKPVSYSFDTEDDLPILLHFLKLCDNDIKSLRDHNAELTKRVSNSNHKLEIAEAAILAQENSTDKLFWQTDKETWEKLYRSELKLRRAAEAEVKKIKETVEFGFEKTKGTAPNWQQFNVGKLNERLRTLRQLAKGYERYAKHWEHEYRLATIEQDVRRVGFEKQLEAQQVEMFRCTKEYHDKTYNADYWEMEPLQKKIESLEWDLASTNEILGQTKRDKARLEDEVQQVSDAKKKHEKYTVRLWTDLMYGDAANRSVKCRPDSSTSSTDASPPSSIPWLTHPKKVELRKRIPRCLLPPAIQERKKIMDEFCRNQQMERDADDAKDKIIEMARKWKMGSLYPPSKPEWKEFSGKDAWERYDVDYWTRTQASQEERRIVQVLGEREM